VPRLRDAALARGSVEQGARPGDATARPSISVVVPTFGRPQELRGCLEALAALDYPRERYEVVVVDDGSDPPMGPWAGATDAGLRIRWLRQANAGPAAARNAGARAATAEILAFTDDDCRPASDWLSAIAAALARDPEALCGGTTTNALEHSACSVASHAIVDVAIEHLHARGDDLRFFPSNNLALRADAFASIGGFDEAFRTAEDRDLCDRWLRAGRPLVRAPLAKVAHRHVLSPAGFWRQHFGYGRGACRLHRERFRRGAPRFVPDLGYYTKVFRRPVAAGRPGVAFGALALLCVWQLANVAGFLWEGVLGDRRRKSPRA
jgi:GT2 family glycosyltransferase